MRPSMNRPPRVLSRDWQLLPLAVLGEELLPGPSRCAHVGGARHSPLCNAYNTNQESHPADGELPRRIPLFNGGIRDGGGQIYHCS